jgi:hypothetical protein
VTYQGLCLERDQLGSLGSTPCEGVCGQALAISTLYRHTEGRAKPGGPA